MGGLREVVVDHEARGMLVFENAVPDDNGYVRANGKGRLGRIEVDDIVEKGRP
ncbi:hypothetical protein [Aeromicrobium sp. UC242_57]|uniref:hypothetical protein n=1 Tax=Aeromicrobium sp. UC242_57 TaxID=3374624 RepID=UPI0037C05D60